LASIGLHTNSKAEEQDLFLRFASSAHHPLLNPFGRLPQAAQFIR